MRTSILSCTALSSLFACAVATGCDLSQPSDDDDVGETGGDEDDPTDDDDDDDDSDPTDDDDSSPDPDTSGGSEDPTDPTGDPTGGSGDALPYSVFMFIHEDGNAGSVHAYDVATNQTWLVTDFGGGVEVSGLAIHPDRTSLAIAAYHQLSDIDESAGIWRVPVTGGEPQNIMPALAGEDGEYQSVADLVYTEDGAYVYFGHSTSFGGGTIARVADSGGQGEFFVDTNAGCAGVTAPSPSPNGAELMAVRDSCQDYMLEGIVNFAVPPSNAGQVFLAQGDSYSIHGIAPYWLADGTGLLYSLSNRIDTDGDGLLDAQGDGIALLDFASGTSFELVPVAPGQGIHAFAVSPDEGRVVMCMGSSTVRDLVLLDVTGESPAYYTLTNDGASCRVAW
jgi:hypothetical protein